MVSKKKIHNLCNGKIENPSLGIIVCHHSARLVMPNSDPRDGFSILPSHPDIFLQYTDNTTLVKADPSLRWVHMHTCIVVRTKSDSDVKFCLQLLSKTFFVHSIELPRIDISLVY